MSNANRDYAIVYDIKNGSLVLSRPLNFYITDKNTSNIFVKLVTRIIVGNGIDQYVDIENASNYVLTMRVIKPNNEVKSIEATQHETESIFQFDLTEDFKDIPGKYTCELTISTIVNSRQELITSDPFSYEVKRSILSNVGEIIETEDTTVEKLLNDLNATKAEFSSQIKDIKNNMQNIGNPTDEQVKNAINEAIANGDIIAGGLTSTAQTLLISILRSSVFTSNQSANITLLQSELAKGNSGGSSGGGSETTKYTITNTLNNATTSNNVALVDANSSYTATITINDGYTLDTITITMGGTDITSSAVSGTTITISAVTGNVVITVTTSEASSGGGTTELPQDGLTAFFDMRNATIEKSYNQVGWGNVTKAAVSSCSEYYMFNIVGDYITNDYGIANWGIRGIRQSANTTTKLSIDKLNNSIIGLVYGNCICGLYSMTTTTNIGEQILFTPTYVNKSGSKIKLPSVKVNARNYKDLPGYSLYAITQSPTEIKLYIDGQLKHTTNVSECTDFDHWVNANDDNFIGCHFSGASNYTTACAFYNKTLSDVEVVEATEYFKTLEVK